MKHAAPDKNDPIRIQDKPYYRPDEMARCLDVSVKTVQRKIREKKIRAVLVGRLARIPRAELLRHAPDALLARQV